MLSQFNNHPHYAVKRLCSICDNDIEWSVGPFNVKRTRHYDLISDERTGSRPTRRNAFSTVITSDLADDLALLLLHVLHSTQLVL